MIMNNFDKLPSYTTPERYAIIELENQTKLACLVRGDWTVDATCRSLNEMIEIGVVSKESVSEWINFQSGNRLYLYKTYN
jgi:hypothetical protein